MEIEVLGAFGGESPDCRLTCLLVNGGIALDAGSLSQSLDLERQVKVRSIVLSHSHMDHTNGLPFFIDNVFGRNDRGLDIYASSATIYAVRKHLFNSATWPDFSRLPNHLLPSIRFHEFADEEPFVIDGVRFTPIPVNHVVPTHGFLIEHGDAALLWSSDTGPTERLWEVANRTPQLGAVCIDVSFDNQLQAVADDSGHLTPHSLDVELSKLERDVPVLVHHMKPFCIDAIEGEIAKLERPELDYLEQGRIYRYGESGPDPDSSRTNGGELTPAEADKARENGSRRDSGRG